MNKPAGSTSKKAFLKNAEGIMEDAANTKRCDVLVETSSTDGALAAGLRIINTLWASDISAELATIPTRTSEYSLIVSVRHEASHSVRVRSAATESDEVDVPLVSLVSHLQSELREKEVTTNKTRPPAFTRHSGHHESADRRGNVHVLMAQHRSKKSNKYHIVEAAQNRWAERLDEWKDAPILAIETSDGVLESIKDTRLSDQESWRRSVQGVQLNERQYLGQVQDILAAWRKKWTEGDGVREACVFNFRTGNCIYYDVGL